MSVSVAERGRAIATFRFVEVRLMEMAAAWTPTTPEMEVKVLLGRHIWDFAQHADALGRRTFELRQPLQHSVRPAESYVGLLEAAAGVTATGERLAVLYDVILPGLDRRYAAYVRSADPILDAPSLVILEHIRSEERRQREEAQALRREIGLAVAAPASLSDPGGALEDVVAPVAAP